MKNEIYLDNAATTLVAPEALKAMSQFFESDYGNAGSPHRFGRIASEALGKARKAIAGLINAHPKEIVFTSGGTESNNLALKGALSSAKSQIITTAAEHNSVLNACKALEKAGKSIQYVSVDGDGFVNIKELEAKISKKTALVSAIHGNNEIGTINDIAEISKLCRDKGVLFHTDACQSFAKEKIDVKKMNIDMMTLNAHKIHGPKGVGALYVRDGVELEPLMNGGEQEHELRPGTENVAGAVGFAAAALSMKDSDVDRMRKLRDRLIDFLLSVKGSRLNGSRTKRLCNNINVSFDGVEGHSLVMHLDSAGIMASTGSACNSHIIEPSHVLKAIGLSDGLALGGLRLSLSKYTTPEEIEVTYKNVKTIVESLRKVSEK